MIRIVNLSKVHRTDEVETTALNAINLEVSQGEFLSIMGPSGCGKSTLLNIIGLMDTPTGGEYFFGDKEVAKYNESQRAELRKNNIGVIFQSFNLIDELTVYQNVDLALLYQKVPAEERKQRVAAVLEKVGIGHRQKHYPQQLSGGQQQRVAVARALGGSPRILLADEPTGNLDSKNGAKVMDMLKELNDDGATICMVTHDERYNEIASRTVHLFDGKIVDETVATANA